MQAAAALGLSVASRQLRALEEHVGASLVRRTTRELNLTSEGHEYLERVRQILSQVEDAARAVARGVEVRGPLVVSLPVSLGLGLVAPLLPAFLTRYPAVELDVSFEDRGVDLVEAGVDVAVRAGLPVPDSASLVARRLATFERVLCAAPAYLLARGAPDAVAALAEHDCILHNARAGRLVWRFESLAGPQSVDVRGVFRTNNVLALRDAALAGIGIAALPMWLVAEALRAGALVRVLAGSQMPTVEVVGLHDRDARGLLRVRAFVDYLASVLPGAVGSRG